MMSSSGDRPLVDLLTSYSDLNGDRIAELDEEPSPLEFMRYVHRNTPFVIRRGALGWRASQLWDAKYLKTALSHQDVNVAVTPKGNADAPTYSPEHSAMVIAKPHEEDQPFDEFLDYVQHQESAPATVTYPEVRYAQTQNDNLRNEYSALYQDVQKDIPWARVALDKPPDAINLWIGNSKSVTALHKDPMENIYVQMMLPATYARDPEGGLQLTLDNEKDPVPLAMWDPDRPQEDASRFSHLAEPVRVTLEPGDMLYLPAMWYHKVSQSCIPGEEPFVLAVNYWFDMEYSGLLYPVTNFIRDVQRHAPSLHS